MLNLLGFVESIGHELGLGLGKMKADWVLDSPGQAKIFARHWPASLAMKVPPDHNSWEKRGEAPMIYQKKTMPQRFSVTTEISYTGQPDAAIAGPIIYDSKVKHYAVQLGCETNPKRTIISLQKPWCKTCFS